MTFIHKDKIYHFLISFILTIVLYFVVGLHISITTTLLVGIAKEVYDHKYGTSFSIGDLLADIAGIILAIGCLL